MNQVFRRRVRQIALPSAVLICAALLPGPAATATAAVADGDVHSRVKQADKLAADLEHDGIIGAPVHRRQVKDLNGGITIESTNKECIAYRPAPAATDIYVTEGGATVERAPGVEVPPPYDCPVPDHVMNHFKAKMYPQGEQLGFARRNERAIYPFKDDPRTLMVQNEGHSDRFMAVFESDDAATYMDFKMELPQGYFMDTTEQGKLNFKYQKSKGSEVYQVGTTGAPWSRDSESRGVLANWTIIDGNTVRLNIASDRTIDGHPIAYPLVADPWLSVGWDWFPPGPTFQVHMDYDETHGFADSADDVDNLTVAMCGALALIPPPEGAVLAIVCAFVAATWFEMIGDVAADSALDGCGSVLDFDLYWNLDSYSEEC